MRKCFYFLFLVILFHSTIQAQTVYITKTGSKYHSSNCQYLRKSAIPISLKDALDRGYSPCSRCNPPTKITSSTEDKTEKKVVESKSIKGTNETMPIITEKKMKKNITETSGRCQAITKKGTQCKRKAQPGSNYCWQHNR